MHYQDLPPEYFWRFLIIGYMLTIAIETPILLACLSRGHSLARRLFAGLWLTACTYPIVVLVLPLVVPPLFADPQHGEWAYLGVAETFAPLAECALFSLLIKRQASCIAGAVEPYELLDQESKSTESSPSQKLLPGDPYLSPQAELNVGTGNSTRNRATWQDYLAIIAANLTSFLGGEWLLKNVAWLSELITIQI